jgi:branched-chain amino acid transport system permease protein
MELGFFLQLLPNGLIVDALCGVVAMSFMLIYRASQVVNFAPGEFLLVGAWVCWWLLTSWQLPFWLGFLVTLTFMTLFGILLQGVVLRPLVGEPVISVIMVTIGLSLLFQALMK